MKKSVFYSIMFVTLSFLIGPSIFMSCTDNQRARSFGGTETINLPKGEKLVNATWKGEKGAADLWYLTEPMDSTYIPKTKHFREQSGYGIMQGTVIFVESK